MSFFVQNDILLYLSFGTAIFFISYKWSPRVLDFIRDKTLSSQKEILEIIEKMRIQKNREKTVLWLWILSLAIAFLMFLITLPNVLLGLGLGFSAFLASWMGLRWVMRSLWTQYCETVADQMVEGMTLMANGMKVGLSVTQSMERVSEGMKGPLGSEFTLVLNKIKLGMSVEEALNEMSARVALPDVVMLVTSVNILKETGGNLAEVFSTIAETIRSRQKVQSKIKALTAQGMMQAKIISFVPLVLLVILYFANPSYVVILFSTALGWVCLFFIAALVIIGGQLMRKVATIDV